MDKKLPIRLLKIGFALALAAAIWWDISQKQNLSQIWAAFLAAVSRGDSLLLATALLLVPLNWAAETLKWHQFVARHEAHFTFWRAYRAVLAGVAFSLFLPNRVGEYGGRILFVGRENQWKAVIANLVGNFSQMIFLVFTGLLGGSWLAWRFLGAPPLVVWAVAAGAFVAAGAMAFAFFNIDALIPLAKRLPMPGFLKKFGREVKVLREFTRRELAEVLGWSTVRGLVYSAQYLLLLYFFGIRPGLVGGFAGVFALFFIQMSVPLPPVTGLLARGNVALEIWGFFGANEVSILASTLSLWAINLILPSLLGAWFLLRSNVSKSLGYDA